jgi:tetratricopeptide (TPR) repeat protein
MGAQAWRGLARPGERRVRLMACVACLGFLAHSLVDVPAHRLGTMMPALLLLGMAVGGEEGGMRRMRWVLPAAGVVAFTFMLTGLGLKPAATMDWQVYARAAGPEAKQREFLAALRDFRQARFLEPDYAGLPYEEGQIWLNVAPQFAIEPWREALRRMPWEGRAELYQQMLAQSYPAHPELHAPLAALAGGDARMELAFLGWTAPEEFQARMDETLRDDPELTRYDTVQLRALFPLWMMKGNATALAAIMSRHPLWMAAGYRALADYDATRGDYAGAIALMEDNVPPPPIPPPAPPIPHDEAAGRFAEDHGDFAAGMALYSEDIAAGQTDAALQILQVLNAQPGCPAYVHIEAGRLLARQGREQEAWQALKQCEP